MFYIVYEKFINKVCSICFCFLIVTTCTQMIMTSLYVEFLKRKDIYIKCIIFFCRSFDVSLRASGDFRPVVLANFPGPSDE